MILNLALQRGLLDMTGVSAIDPGRADSRTIKVGLEKDSSKVREQVLALVASHAPDTEVVFRVVGEYVYAPAGRSIFGLKLIGQFERI